MIINLVGLSVTANPIGIRFLYKANKIILRPYKRFPIERWIMYQQRKESRSQGKIDRNSMRAKELMIGDWISFNGEPAKVQQVVSGINELDYEPILLTAEILEKNGFVLENGKVYPNEKWWMLRDERNLAIFMLDRQFRCSMNIADVKINYVHELQHAFRLCGLTELADNILL